jgi:hypothetical protein
MHIPAYINYMEKQYYQELWTSKEEATIIMLENEIYIECSTLDELLLTLRSFKNKKHQAQTLRI